MEILLVGNPANGVAKPMCNSVGALPVANSHAVIGAALPATTAAPAGATLGRHLAARADRRLNKAVKLVEANLDYAVEAAADFLNKAVKSVKVGGPKIWVAKAREAFAGVADASGYPFAMMPSAKGLVPEHHPPTAATP
jgi:thiamine pyrophosphate-dependent acetolactate synthase large subunit-like protein